MNKGALMKSNISAETTRDAYAGDRSEWADRATPPAGEEVRATTRNKVTVAAAASLRRRSQLRRVSIGDDAINKR